MKSNTINKQEIAKFSKIAGEWWNPEGKFKPLHKFNPIRIKYIKNYITQNFKLNFLIILSFIYFILTGLNLCNGLNLPFGSHHSAAIFENFSISFLFIVFIIDRLLTLQLRCILST